MSDDGSSSIKSQSTKADECDAWLPMDKYVLGFLSDMPLYEEDSRSEVSVEDQDPGPVACACSSCQVETASKRCDHEDKEICANCAQTCACGLTCCVRSFLQT